jgi:Zn-dependent protease with chaperone function/uncharacterized tellurite resistance protein B-like protein
MDFFERQDQAHRNTKRLIVYFVAGVAALIVTIYLTITLIFAGFSEKSRRRQPEFDRYGRPKTSLWNPQWFAGVSLGTLAVITIGSLTRTMQLRSGGSAVSEMMGGRLINPGSANPDERKLLNVVEEMALASGLPVPPVYVMDNEDGINAFAAGHTISDATVTVTSGCMRNLTRDELQGVIGHEFSHILNGDMRLNLRLMGTIFGILCLAVVGRVLLRVRSSGRGKGQNPLPLIGLVLIIFGWIGVFFGRLIQAAVSRQREFLADASAVQFTRNPSGIAGALKKIGNLGSKLESAHASEASHMFFGNGLGEPFFGLLATHPPLVDRIKAIDPNFDGNFEITPLRTLRDESPLQTKRPVTARADPIPIPMILKTVIAAGAVMPQVGTPTPAHLQYAEQLRTSFPASVQAAAREPFGAATVIYALLLGSDAELRAKQLQLLTQLTAEGVRKETERLLPDVSTVAAVARLPLIDLALPALRQLSPAQYEQFSKTVHALIESDNDIDLFEYVLQKIVLRHLEPQFGQTRRQVVQYYALKPLAPDCSVLLSAMAHAGETDSAKARAAFQRGAGQLSSQAQASIEFLAQDQCDLSQVDAALTRLNLAVPQIKKNVLDACAQTVAADGVIQEMEAELLRGVADTLDCPMPPLLEAKAA